MERIRTTLEPSDIKPNIVNRLWILSWVNSKFENSRTERVWPKLPLGDEWVRRRPPCQYIERRNVEWATRALCPFRHGSDSRSVIAH